MKNRLIKNWLTTSLGVICVGVSIYLFVSEKHTQLEAVEMSALALLFLRSKDSLIGIYNSDDAE
jgi:hypothetical protein